MRPPQGWSPLGLSIPEDRGDPGRRLRPAPFNALFEIGGRILKRHAMVLLALAVVFQLPVAVLTSVAAVRLGDTIYAALPDLGSGTVTTIVLTEAQLQRLLGALLLVLAGSAMGGLMAAIAMCGYAAVVGGDYRGEPVGVRGAAACCLRRGPAAIGSVILSTLATLAMLALGAIAAGAAVRFLSPGGVSAGGLGVFLALVAGVAAALAVVYVSLRWSLATVAVALEDAGPGSSLRRSWHLTSGHVRRTLGVIVVIGVIVSVLSALVAQLLDVVLVDAVAAPAGVAVIAETLAGALVTVLFAPAAPVVQAVLYHDLRVRVDGWDVPLPEAPGMVG